MYSSKEFRVNAQGERYLVGQFHTNGASHARNERSERAKGSPFLGSLYTIVITIAVTGAAITCGAAPPLHPSR
jgi:hypothetical protein